VQPEFEKFFAAVRQAPISNRAKSRRRQTGASRAPERKPAVGRRARSSSGVASDVTKSKSIVFRPTP